VNTFAAVLTAVLIPFVMIFIALAVIDHEEHKPDDAEPSDEERAE